MSLIKRSEWPLPGSGSWLSDFFDNERFFDSDLLRNRTLPAINVKETEQNYQIEVAAPGRSKADFNILTEHGMLIISAEKKEEKQTKENDYTRQEFSYSSFSRSFTLPDNANEHEIKANYTDGIVKVEIAKKITNHTKTRKAIEVK